MQVLHQTDHNKPAWDQLAWGVRTGGQPFEETHGGLSQFAWLKTKPAEEQKFSKAMTEIDSMGGALCRTPLPTLLKACRTTSSVPGVHDDSCEMRGMRSCWTCQLVKDVLLFSISTCMSSSGL